MTNRVVAPIQNHAAAGDSSFQEVTVYVVLFERY